MPNPLKENNIAVFLDTKKIYNTDKELIESIRNSVENQYIVKDNEHIDIDAPKKDRPAEMIVSKKRTFEAAGNYRDKKVCVLNFASFKNPGGGVAMGATAQEECLCRISTLYACLTADKIMNNFYNPHRKMFGNSIYTDDLIFTPGVTVIKSDTSNPQTLPPEQRFNTDVITCAAPNLMTSFTQVSNEELEKILTKRVDRIFAAAAKERAEVLILGAFGCGAFRNPPRITAKVMKTLCDKYACYFDVIEFAVYCTKKKTENYDAFAEAFGKV